MFIFYDQAIHVYVEVRGNRREDK